MSAPLERTSTPGVYKRGRRYVVAYRDPAGKQRRRSAASLAEARALKAEVSADMRRGEYRSQSRITFKEYAEEWARTYTGRTSRGIRPATLEDYVRDLEVHVLPVFGHRRLAEIEPRHVKVLAADLAAEGRAPSTVRNIIAPVRALFATAVEDGVIRMNPCAGLRLPGGTSPDKHARALTEDELSRLITETPEEWRLLVSFLAQTGLRVGNSSRCGGMTWISNGAACTCGGGSTRVRSTRLRAATASATYRCPPSSPTPSPSGGRSPASARIRIWCFRRVWGPGTLGRICCVVW